MSTSTKDINMNKTLEMNETLDKIMSAIRQELSVDDGLITISFVKGELNIRVAGKVLNKNIITACEYLKFETLKKMIDNDSALEVEK